MLFELRLTLYVSPIVRHQHAFRCKASDKMKIRMGLCALCWALARAYRRRSSKNITDNKQSIEGRCYQDNNWRL